MESNFNNRDFERFVKQNADQYRMFPSEKVWKGIHSALHSRRRWYGIGATLLLLTIGSVTWVMVSSSSGKSQPDHTIIPLQPARSQKADDVTSKSNNKISFVPDLGGWQKDLTVSNSEKNIIKESNSILNSEPETMKEIIVNNKNRSGIITDPVPLFNEDKIYYPSVINSNPVPSIIDDNFDVELNKVSKSNITENKIADKSDIYPLSIESVVNSFEYTRRKSLSWQIYFAPTISYRRLAENKAFLSSPLANNTYTSYAALYDINTAVTHKPDMGFELGFSAGYSLNSYLKIIGGLQFNVSKYDIRAYTTYPTELATVALTNGNGTRSSGSVSTLTNYRNFGGNKTNWLHNLYLSASAPIGAELRLKGDNETYLGLAGTLQPTYILGDRAYMISTDYKNYVEIPQLIRRWNVSTSIETFVGYSTGKINWKVGPQVRYQLFSSFEKKYPVKEHIFDFGLKVGVMLNQ